MATNSDPPPPGHINSPLFTRLPTELRLIIYREVFMGSKQKVVRVKDRTDPNNRHTEFERICMPRNRQFALVQTFKATYNEARHMYWCQTAVTCAHMSLQANLNAIPYYARPRVRVLEGVAPEDYFNPTNRMSLVQFLGHFTKLQYCQFKPQTVHIYCHCYEVPPEGLLTKAGSDTFRNLARTLNPEKPPVFVQRIYVWPEKDRDRVDWVYVNHTHARLFITARGSISDEEGFRRVAGPVQQFQETYEMHEDEDTDDVDTASDAKETQDVDEGYEADDERDVNG